MDKRELHAIARLMGYEVTAVCSRFNPDFWSSYVTNKGEGVMHVISTLNPSKETALAHGWDWVRHNVDIFKGGTYEAD